MSYNDSKKILDTIRQDYSCKGELIFRCAIQNIIECGTNMLLTEDYLEAWLKDIDTRHDAAEANGQYLFIGRDFEKAIAECTVKIAEIASIDIIMYMQRNIWFYDRPNEISHERAMDLLKSTVGYCLQDREIDVAREDLDYIGFDDDDLKALSFEEVFFDDEEY